MKGNTDVESNNQTQLVGLVKRTKSQNLNSSNKLKQNQLTNSTKNLMNNENNCRNNSRKVINQTSNTRYE